jgi:probable addiction module antidote protein
MRKTPIKPVKGKPTKTIPYDIAEQLRTPKEMAAYLDAWLDEAPEDASGIARALGDIARAKGMTQVAKDAGLSRESLYRALSADGNPSFATVLKVARARRRRRKGNMTVIYEFDVKDMPVTVAVSSDGTSVHTTGPREWQSKIGKIPVAVV